MTVRIHSTSEVSPEAVIGEGTSIWLHCQIRSGVVIGKNCNLGKGVYVDAGVKIGSNVKIQNYVSIYHGVTIEDGAFIGPHVCFTNDMRPRSINPDGAIKDTSDWIVTETLIGYGAALGANSTIRCGVKIGKWAMIGSGSVVTRDVPEFGLVYGNPTRIHGFVCPCGAKVEKMGFKSDTNVAVITKCPNCGYTLEIPFEQWDQIE